VIHTWDIFGKGRSFILANLCILAKSSIYIVGAPGKEQEACSLSLYSLGSVIVTLKFGETLGVEFNNISIGLKTQLLGNFFFHHKNCVCQQKC